MNAIEASGKLLGRIGDSLINLARQGCLRGPDSAVVVYKLQTRFPHNPPPDIRAMDPWTKDHDVDTLYKPIFLGLDASAAVEDGCPMAHEVTSEGIHITLGHRDCSLGLLFTDQALLNMTRLLQTASREMLYDRKQPVPRWLGGDLE